MNPLQPSEKSSNSSSVQDIGSTQGKLGSKKICNPFNFSLTTIISNLFKPLFKDNESSQTAGALFKNGKQLETYLTVIEKSIYNAVSTFSSKKSEAFLKKILELEEQLKPFTPISVFTVPSKVEKKSSLDDQTERIKRELEFAKNLPTLVEVLKEPISNDLNFSPPPSYQEAWNSALKKINSSINSLSKEKQLPFLERLIQQSHQQLQEIQNNCEELLKIIKQAEKDGHQGISNKNKLELLMKQTTFALQSQELFKSFLESHNPSLSEKITRTLKAEWIALNQQISSFSFSKLTTSIKVHLKSLPTIKQIVGEVFFKIALERSSPWLKEKILKIENFSSLPLSEKQNFFNALTFLEQNKQLADQIDREAALDPKERLTELKQKIEKYTIALTNSSLKDAFTSIKNEINDSIIPLSNWVRALFVMAAPPFNKTLTEAGIRQFKEWLNFFESELVNSQMNSKEELEKKAMNFNIKEDSPYYDNFIDQKAILQEMLEKKASERVRKNFKDKIKSSTLEEQKEFLTWLIFFDEHLRLFPMVPLAKGDPEVKLNSPFYSDYQAMRKNRSKWSPDPVKVKSQENY